jgi:hypothetical protein
MYGTLYRTYAKISLMTSLWWIIFLALLFWGIYQKWDEKRLSYIEEPIKTTLYFLFSSLSIILIYPDVARFFKINFFAILFFILIIGLTFLIYKTLKNLFIGPSLDISQDHAYWKLLDQRFILPKLAEIIFQQTFFASVSLLIIEKYGTGFEVLISMSLSFIMAHVPLFFLQGRKIGMTYLLWSIIGSPIFTIILVTTGSLWYSISVHMLFYTVLSMFTWLFTGTKYSDA